VAVDRATAERISDEILYPAALAVDRADRIPAGHLDLLAAEGFYGVAGHDDLGGLVEALAAGCLTTAFVWIQHHGSVRAAAVSDRPGIRERWLGPLSRGEVRAGVGLAGIRAPTSRLRVRAVDGGYLLDGQTPWITGWGMIDIVHVAGRDADDVIHYLFVDATAAPTLTRARLDLVAARASRTAHVTFANHFVPADRLTATQPYQEWAATDAAGTALNGFLALGVANRCIRLMDSTSLVEELDACRAALRAAEGPAVAAARAGASHLALRAAAELVVRTGSRAVLLDQHAQRLMREATFLLVFGSRPGMKEALLTRLTR
jgi:alkylation response protein AidB-like acyl-CoA dehydrogenase